MTHTNSNANDGAWVLAPASNTEVLNTPLNEKFRSGQVQSYGAYTVYGPTDMLLVPRFFGGSIVPEDAPLAFITEQDDSYEATNGWTEESHIGRISVVDMESGKTWVALDEGPVSSLQIAAVNTLYGGQIVFKLVALLKNGQVWFVEGDAAATTGDGYVRTRMPLAGNTAIKASAIRARNKCVWAIGWANGELYGQGTGSFGKVEVAKTAVKQLSAPANFIGSNQHFLMTSDRHVIKRTRIGSAVTDEPVDAFAHDKLPTSVPVQGFNDPFLPTQFVMLNNDGTIQAFSREWEITYPGSGVILYGDAPTDRTSVLAMVAGGSGTPAAPAGGWAEVYDVPCLYMRDPDQSVVYNRVALVMRNTNGFLYAAEAMSWDDVGQRFATAALQLSLGEPLNSVAVYKGKIITIRPNGSLGYWITTRAESGQTYPASPMASMEYPIQAPSDGITPVFTKLVSSEGVLSAIDSLGRIWSTRGEGEEFLDHDTIVGPLRCCPVGNTEWRYTDVKAVNYNGGIARAHSQIVGGPYNGDWRAALVVTRDTGVKYVIGWPKYATPGYTTSPGQFEEFGVATGLPGELANVTVNTLVMMDGSVYQYNLDVNNVDGQIDGRGFQTDFVLVDDTRQYADVDGDFVVAAAATNSAAENVLMMWGLNSNLITMPWKPSEEKLAPTFGMTVNVSTDTQLEVYALSPTDGAYMLNAVQYALGQVTQKSSGELVGAVPMLNIADRFPINAPVYDFDTFSNYAPRPWELRQVGDIGMRAENLAMYPYYRTARMPNGMGLYCVPITPAFFYGTITERKPPPVVSVDGKIPSTSDTFAINLAGEFVNKVALYDSLKKPLQKYGYATLGTGRFMMWGAARPIVIPNGGVIDTQTLRALTGRVPPASVYPERAWPSNQVNNNLIFGNSQIRSFYGRVYFPSRQSMANNDASGSGPLAWRMFMTPVGHNEIVSICGGPGFAGVVSSSGAAYQCAPDNLGTIVWRKWADIGRLVAIYGAQRCDYKIARRADGTLWSSRSYAQVGADAGWGDVAITGFESINQNNDSWRVGWASIRDSKLYAWGHDKISGIPGTPADTPTPNSETQAPTEIGAGRTWVSVVDGGFALTDDGDMYAFGNASYWAHMYSGTVADPLNVNVLAQFTGKWIGARMLSDGNGGISDITMIRADGAMIRSLPVNGITTLVVSPDRNWTAIPRRDVAVQDSVAALTLNWSAS